MFIQLFGMSGAGKSTLAVLVKEKLINVGVKVYILDGDYYRKTLNCDLGFSKEDRRENIRRMAFIANEISKFGIIPIISAINPYAEFRNEIKNSYENVKLVFVQCAVEVLIERDTKGFYRRALLPDSDSQKIKHFSGISDPFEIHSNPDFVIDTTSVDEMTSANLFYKYILSII